MAAASGTAESATGAGAAGASGAFGNAGGAAASWVSAALSEVFTELETPHDDPDVAAAQWNHLASVLAAGAGRTRAAAVTTEARASSKAHEAGSRRSRKRKRKRDREDASRSAGGATAATSITTTADNSVGAAAAADGGTGEGSATPAATDASGVWQMIPAFAGGDDQAAVQLEADLTGARFPLEFKQATSKGRTILCEAAKLGLRACVRALLQRGANVNTASDGDAHTPLHYAAYYGRENVVETLLRAGADTEALNRFGETPRAVAVARGHRRVADAIDSFVFMNQYASAPMEAFVTVPAHGSSGVAGVTRAGAQDPAPQRRERGAVIEANPSLALSVPGHTAAVSSDVYALARARGMSQRAAVAEAPVPLVPGAKARADKRARDRLWLVVVAAGVGGLELGHKIRASKSRGVSIGRSRRNTLVVLDAAVSKAHARVAYRQGVGFAIRDDGSNNGTFLDGTRLSDARVASPWVPLAGDSHITVGATVLRVTFTKPTAGTAHTHSHSRGTAAAGHVVAGATRVSGTGNANAGASGAQPHGGLPSGYGAIAVSGVAGAEEREEADRRRYRDRARERRRRYADNPDRTDGEWERLIASEPVVTTATPLPGDHKGRKLLAKLGWTGESGRGLGAPGREGRVEPVAPTHYTERRGLGSLSMRSE